MVTPFFNQFRYLILRGGSQSRKMCVFQNSMLNESVPAKKSSGCLNIALFADIFCDLMRGSLKSQGKERGDINFPW